MYYLKLQSAVQIMAFLALLSACDKAETFDGNNEHSVKPDGLTGHIPVTPLKEGISAPSPNTPSPESDLRSADSLRLTIEDAPFSEAAPVGSGTTTDNSWLDGPGNDTGSQNIPSIRTLLPNLFGQAKDNKDVSVEGKLLLNDDEEEITDKVDGAGVSIRYNTD